MTEPNEITLLFTHILLRKSPTSLLYVSIKSALALRPPAYCLRGYCALITVCSGQKKKKESKRLPYAV